MSAVNNTNQPLKAIGYMLLAIATFSTVNVFVKLESASYGIGQIMFFRDLFGLLPAGLIWAFKQDRKPLRVVNLPAHFLRALFGNAGLFCFFLSLNFIDLTEAGVASFTSTLFLTALAWPLLKEHVGAHRWIAVFIGFSAAAIAYLPYNAMQAGVLIALAGALFDALHQILARRLSWSEDSATLHLFYVIVGTAFTGVLVVLTPSSVGLESSALAAKIFGWKAVDQDFI